MLYKPSVGPKKTLTCTLATATWTSDGSTIPAMESTRWGRTLQASDFPVWSFPPASVKYIEKCLVSIRNDSGSTQTTYWKMYKNNSLVTSGSVNFGPGTYRAFMADFYNVAVGDILEFAVWTATNTNITVVGSLKHVVPTQLLPTSKPCIEVSYTYGKYTYPSPSTDDTVSSSEYIGSNISNNIFSSTSRTFTGLSFISQNGYGLFRYGDGDVNTKNTAVGIVHASLQQIENSYYPTTISYREIRRGI
jgi:hypothetical protein